MIATLHSYENLFGPYHLQTLALTVQVAQALWAAGEQHNAQRLLEYCLKHLDGHGDQTLTLRVSTLTPLRDLLIERLDFEKATAVQREIVVCRTQVTGPEDPNVICEKARLASMLMSAVSEATTVNNA